MFLFLDFFQCLWLKHEVTFMQLFKIQYRITALTSKTNPIICELEFHIIKMVFSILSFLQDTDLQHR